jgi:SAM-dependent methyltransferase
MNEDQKEYWNGGAAEIWVAQQERLDRQLAPLGRAAFAALAPRAGERILDVGCGGGTTTFGLAEAVGPGGRVVGVDLSAPLLAAARGRNRSPNVAFVQADAQTHTFDETFDAIYSRFGVMFFADPAGAFANLRRTLVPGGRLAFVCWRAMKDNPLMSAPIEAAMKHLPPLPPPPDPEAPGPFAFADRARIERILEGAGYRDVVITPHDQRIGDNDRATSLELALQIGPLGRILRELPDKRAVVVDAVREALEPYIVDGFAQFPSATWIVRAKA